jgi:hypothetical protein
MKKYTINRKPVPQKEFFTTLRSDCQKVVSTDVIAGWCGVDVCDFDSKKYDRMCKTLRQGVTVIFFDSGRVYDTQKC